MTHETLPPLLGVALDAAARSWHVFPLRRFSKRPALHREDRCPRTGVCAGGHRKWEQRATTDPDRIRRAWADVPFNVGIATGPSGLVVVDLDVPKTKSSADTPSGVTNFRALCERAGQPFPTTYETRTAGGGIHLYFTAPPGIRLGNTAGKLGQYIDTRAWGGYVVAAGSITATCSYTIADSTPPVPLPVWLLGLLQPAPPRPVGPLRLPAVSGSRAARAALEQECAEVSAAPDKQRNITLNRCAFKVGRFVAWGDLPRGEVEDAFQAVGEARGLTAAECRSTIRSALDSSIRKARPRDAA
ncbi:bifunctional DNA primase/polymerase [Streptomyces sp. ME19-01-6]|uniref:bifunctional DNA primase/polymerase n=1 Tax=Streptomyces sp. ME19-01-6 TaxID=3028686 RepID=UPI0029A77E1F|nr:bifunctional DNA primase/polymerase [Streptomyces sp. ME19-01-6]MDX3226092.1 bifunctional DNA primase/polymerase [Streptomyces sp. ME19-01-6]